MFKILFIGDIVGKLGRAVCQELIPGLKAEFSPDLIIANGENSAHGYSISVKIYQELAEVGIDALTMGNHIWDKKEIIKDLDKFPNMVRPGNYPPGTPGKDHLILEKHGQKVALLNFSGRTFMQALDCPFRAAEALLPKIAEANIKLVDIHAEATSEKCAFAWFLDGKVSAVLGTHTHVMTADERILPGGTAFISDVGMVGAYESIIGMNREQILKRFITQLPEKFEPTEKGQGLFNAVLLEIDTATGKALAIRRISKLT